MVIKSFSRMKSYRFDGRVVAILKLILPRAESENGDNKNFNALYTSLAETYMSMTEKLSHNAGGAGRRPITVSVSFAPLQKEQKISKKRAHSSENILVIRRTVSVNDNGNVRRTEFVDMYDTALQVFIK